MSASYIESHQLFSRSHIWQLQKAFFTEAGIEAWQSGRVPHYITSNAVVGRTYAELVLAMLRDLAVRGENAETIYIVELGAGHGRLAYHFLKYFEQYYEKSALKLAPVCYVLTDFVQSNLEFWETHPRLQPFMEMGWLDYSLFNAESDDVLKLSHANQSIEIASLNQPIIVIANYFFDTIPQELYRFQNKKVEHALLSISSDIKIEKASSEQVIDSLTIEYSYAEAGRDIYKDSSFLNDLLNVYHEHLTDSHVLIPHQGLQCLDRLKSLSKAGLMLLSADKGEHHLSNMDNHPPPELIKHGSFSFTVNYHAFKMYCEHQGGIALFPMHQHSSLDLGCLLLLEGASSFTETRCAYDKFVQNFGPDDFFNIKNLPEKCIALSYREIASLIRFSGYDAGIFQQLFPTLLNMLPKLMENERWNILLMIPRIWATYYPIKETDDLACDLGKILLNLEFYKEAILYFEKSILIYGKKPDVLLSLALCHCMMNNVNAAMPTLIELMRMDSARNEVQELIETFGIKMP